MTKNVTLISVAVTTVVLMTLAGVVYAYQVLITPQTAMNTSVSPQTVAFPLIASAASTSNTDISPQDAAAVAVKFSNRTDLYSIEVADFNGSQTYKLTFSTGDVLYIGLDGQVVGSAPPTKSMVASPTSPPPPAVIYTDPIKKQASSGNHNNSGGGGGGHDGGGEHEGGGD